MKTQYFNKFRSRKFINFYQIDKNIIFYPKQFLINLAILFICSAMIIFCTIGFINIKNNSVYFQTMRAVSIFFICWYCFFSFWTIKIGINLIKNNPEQIDNYFVLFSFILIFSLIWYFICCKKIKFYELKDYILSFFKNNKPINFKSSEYILNVILLIIMFPMVVLIWLPQYDTKPDYPGQVLLNNIWFYGLQYFTIQTNLLCFIHCLLFVFFRNSKIFKNNNFSIWCISYILIVSITYNAGLLPIKIASNETQNWNNFKWTKTMWEHVVNPIFFIGITSFILYKTRKQQDWLTCLKFGMIIPTIYLIYATVLPFVSTESVYDVVTNCNPNLMNSPSSFLKHGEWYVCFFIIAYWFLFIIVITLFWLLNYQFNKKQKNIIKGIK